MSILIFAYKNAILPTIKYFANGFQQSGFFILWEEYKWVTKVLCDILRLWVPTLLYDEDKGEMSILRPGGTQGKVPNGKIAPQSFAALELQMKDQIFSNSILVTEPQINQLIYQDKDMRLHRLKLHLEHRGRTLCSYKTRKTELFLTFPCTDSR